MLKLKFGDSRKIARLAGISPQLLCDILKGRRQCGSALANKLTEAANSLGYKTTFFNWLFPK